VSIYTLILQEYVAVFFITSPHNEHITQVQQGEKWAGSGENYMVILCSQRFKFAAINVVLGN